MEKPMFADVKVGDRVWSVLCGWGVVVDIDTSHYPVDVNFDAGSCDCFTFEGKQEIRDTSPALFWDEIKIVPPPRPKRKVTKTLEGWINLYPGGSTSGNLHPTESVADQKADPGRIACVHVTGTYEVEE